MNQDLDIYTDGGSRGNPGPSAIGVVIKDKQGRILHQFGQMINNGTNNVAEYQGVIFALKYLILNQVSPPTINFFLDSTLVVNQLNGLWKIKDSNLRILVIKVRELEGQLKTTTIYHPIPREKNFEADALLNQALDSII
jgi:ribonuclease HI